MNEVWLEPVIVEWVFPVVVRKVLGHPLITEPKGEVGHAHFFKKDNFETSRRPKTLPENKMT